MLRTKRLILRPATDEEMEAYIANESDPEIIKAYGEMLRFSQAHPEQRLWYVAWSIDALDGTHIGDLCFKGLEPDGMADLGYGIHPAFWGKGYATEAVLAILDWAFAQPGVSRIEAETDPDNRASQRVLEKAGFLPTGTFGEEGPRFVRER